MVYLNYWRGHDLPDDEVQGEATDSPTEGSEMQDGISPMRKLRCPHCGWDWVRRVPWPKQCPKCKNRGRDWDEL